MAVHEHETRIVEGDGSSGILAGIAVVALLFLAFILFFNWNGTTGTVVMDTTAVSEVNPGRQ